MKKKIWLVLMGAALLVNAAAWKSSRFCDFYAEKIFPVWSGISSRVTALFPFSVGEWMIVAGVGFAIVFAASAILRLTVQKSWSRRLFSDMKKALCWGGLAFFWVMTCNCFLLYHSTAIEERYADGIREGNYSRKELAALRDYIVVNANELAGSFPRDDNGWLVYEGDMKETAAQAMRSMGEEYERLKGYYPEPKEIYFSDLLSQTHMKGYYFPFSMEANYNKTMYVANKPNTICHEFAHLKGFIREDEANLIGYLACVSSEDPLFRYSGYLGVIDYVEREFKKSIGNSKKEYEKHPEISEFVYRDNVFLTKEAWQKVEKKAVVSTQAVRKVSRAATTASLKLNGVKEGMASYGGVVKLLLDYYDGILYGDILTTVDATVPGQ